MPIVHRDRWVGHNRPSTSLLGWSSLPDLQSVLAKIVEQNYIPIIGIEFSLVQKLTFLRRSYVAGRRPPSKLRSCRRRKFHPLFLQRSPFSQGQCRWRNPLLRSEWALHRSSTPFLVGTIPAARPFFPTNSHHRTIDDGPRRLGCLVWIRRGL